jgi:hypothetical protein
MGHDAMKISLAHSRPWYREPWPWFLMSLPATAVVAGLTTAWIAFHSADGLVVGDYYKAGLAINQTLARDDEARAMALVATLQDMDGTLLVTLSGHLRPYPHELRLALVHPTRQGMDQTFVLRNVGGGRYRVAMPALHDGKWHVHLSDPAKAWRLVGVLHAPLGTPLTLSASAPAVQPPVGD